MTRNKPVIGIIGGSGLDNPEIISNSKEKRVETPFGEPSSTLTTGEIAGKLVVILARHGRQHSIPPSLVPYRANIWALKSLGCTHILATTACGSLREEKKPGDLVFIDQFIDFTKQRKGTFFEDKVVHTAMGQPFDKKLRQLLTVAAEKLKFRYHPTGTMVTVEGPRFSTKAESLMFQKWGAEVINMSTVPEAGLANELGIPYQSIAMVTDYDCWREGEKPVTAEMVFGRMRENAEEVKNLLLEVIRSL